MLFHLRLLLAALTKRKKLLILVLVPPLLYLVLAATTPSSYVVSKRLQVTPQTQVAMGQNAADMVPLSTYLADPNLFLADNLVLMGVREHLLMVGGQAHPEWVEWLPSRFAYFVKRAVTQQMTLTTSGETSAELRYAGADLPLGVALVDYYAQLLDEGVRRARERTLSPQSSPQTGKIEGQKLSVTPEYSWVVPKRLGRAFLLALVTFVGLLASVYLLELTRPTIFSERQAARFLGVEILGSIPNLERVERLLERRSRA